MTDENLKSKVLCFKDVIDYQAGSVVSKTVIDKSVGTVTVFAFDKGQALSEHSAPFDAMVQVVDGQAEILINGKSYIVKENQVIIMPANDPHAVKAIERFKMVLTMIKE
ncbi:MAG: cupin domain-containing protein [Candidatus Aceula meridiana]|nr:cupin domain-containing protein [Candidatus Aceula meridiana]